MVKKASMVGAAMAGLMESLASAGTRIHQGVRANRTNFWIRMLLANPLDFIDFFVVRFVEANIAIVGWVVRNIWLAIIGAVLLLALGLVNIGFWDLLDLGRLAAAWGGAVISVLKGIGIFWALVVLAMGIFPTFRRLMFSMVKAGEIMVAAVLWGPHAVKVLGEEFAEGIGEKLAGDMGKFAGTVLAIVPSFQLAGIMYAREYLKSKVAAHVANFLSAALMSVEAVLLFTFFLGGTVFGWIAIGFALIFIWIEFVVIQGVIERAEESEKDEDEDSNDDEDNLQPEEITRWDVLSPLGFLRALLLGVITWLPASFFFGGWWVFWPVWAALYGAALMLWNRIFNRRTAAKEE